MFKRSAEKLSALVLAAKPGTVIAVNADKVRAAPGSAAPPPLRRFFRSSLTLRSRRSRARAPSSCACAAATRPWSRSWCVPPSGQQRLTRRGVGSVVSESLAFLFAQDLPRPFAQLRALDLDKAAADVVAAL